MKRLVDPTAFDRVLRNAPGQCQGCAPAPAICRNTAVNPNMCCWITVARQHLLSHCSQLPACINQVSGQLCCLVDSVKFWSPHWCLCNSSSKKITVNVHAAGLIESWWLCLYTTFLSLWAIVTPRSGTPLYQLQPKQEQLQWQKNPLREHNLTHKAYELSWKAQRFKTSQLCSSLKS